jgi:hypothetical protein
MSNNWVDGQSVIETSSDYLAYWQEGISIIKLSYVTPVPTGVIRFNLTPRIFRMIYYNQWS